MTAYAIARLKNVTVGEDIKSYLSEIDATLEPYEGYFLIHGGPKIELEGVWPESVIVISFPTLAKAQEWYFSPAYQKILPLRKRNADGDAILIEGVDRDHKATDIFDFDSLLEM